MIIRRSKWPSKHFIRKVWLCCHCRPRFEPHSVINFTPRLYGNNIHLSLILTLVRLYCMSFFKSNFYYNERLSVFRRMFAIIQSSFRRPILSSPALRWKWSRKSLFTIWTISSRISEDFSDSSSEHPVSPLLTLWLPWLRNSSRKRERRRIRCSNTKWTKKIDWA